ncbi:MAG: DNA helicase RecQ [Eubacteriaceae bacterium]|nr:DNA helicase RecQ [Eubacteriaceae bacterium]
MPADKFTLLQQRFGYKTFRPGQETLIDAILNGRDALGIMPTGAGKSLCYQIPALAQDGLSLVISPLISLMKDQVDALVQAGAPAACLNASLDAATCHQVMDQVADGFCNLLYITPERLENPGFLHFIQSIPVALVTVDEAHCVSQWGQDFRPSYLAVAPFVAGLPKRPCVAAFTATATEQVRQDILRLLALDHPKVLVTGFDRPNLNFEVRHPGKKLPLLLSLVNKRRDQSGIVYCSTRKQVGKVAEALCADGISAAPYHAGLPDSVRKKNQEDFIYDRIDVIVATNAFGMGIDKSNVSFVIHYNMPGDLESYYQEAGRAGRDGEPADCILLYSGQDVRTQQFFIDRSHTEMTDTDPGALREKDQERLKAMTFYCHTNECLRYYMLRYFGEDSPKSCGHCSNCNGEKEHVDLTVAAQKILSCIVRTGSRYGITMIIAILRGSKNKRLLAQGFDTLSTYGIMADTSAKRLRQIIHNLENQGYLAVDDGTYPILRPLAKSRDVLFGKATVTADLLIEHKPEKVKTSHPASGSGPSGTVNPTLYDELRALRATLADKQGVPAYVIFSNAALTDMCRKLPVDSDAFLDVSGVGKVKLNRYGKAFIAVIQKWVKTEKPSSADLNPTN